MEDSKVPCRVVGGIKLPTPELEMALSIKETLERRSSLKTLLLLLVLMGTSMVIGDGILTPAISVMSAVSGLQGAVKSFDTTAVVVFSIVIIVALFSRQQFRFWIYIFPGTWRCESQKELIFPQETRHKLPLCIPKEKLLSRGSKYQRTAHEYLAALIKLFLLALSSLSLRLCGVTMETRHL